MTSKQAQKRLGVSDTLLRKYAKEKKINRYGPVGQKNKPFYKEVEIEALFHARQIFEKADGPSTFSVAEEKDIFTILDIDARTFDGAAASFDVCMTWFRKNPQTFFVVKDEHGTVKGYASLLPMQKTSIDQFIRSEISGEDITPDMVLSYAPGETLDLYVMAIAIDPDCNISEKRRYGQRMISGLLAFLYSLADEGVEITTITARSHKTDGLQLLKKIGFCQLRSPVPGHELFRMNIPESGVSYFLVYAERLEKWKEAHETA
jgi:hypothetical protein